jgi:hypothetical protein
MNQDLEKAKEIISTKTFCLMQWFADDVVARGGKVMDEKDIKFLISLNGLTKEDRASFELEDINNGSYDSKKLLSAIENAVKQEKKGIILWTYLNEGDRKVVKEKGYFIKDTGHGSSSWEEVYFSEEAFIEDEISSFKHMFGCVASVATLI